MGGSVGVTFSTPHLRDMYNTIEIPRFKYTTLLASNKSHIQGVHGL